MGASGWVAGVLAIALAACLACGSSPASLTARVSVLSVGRTCASLAPVTTCTIVSRLEVAIEEETGRDVSLEAVAGTLWDTRGMQDMQATPAVLSAEDIRNAAGSNVVPGHGSRTLPYSLEFTIPEPYILGTIKASVQVRGVDEGGNMTEANCDTLLVAPVR